MKTKLTLLLMLFASFSLLKAADLPLDFETGTFEFTDFDGGVATVIDNPQSTGINTSTKVGQMVKNTGQTWGGSWIGLENPIDFSTNKTFKIKVFSPRADAKLTLKVENLTDGGINFEKEVQTTVANEWEELSFDFNLINTAESYQKVVLIFDNGTMGDGTSNYTFLFDDIELVYEAPTFDPTALPMDFESSNVDYTFNNFDGGVVTVIDNPQISGINTSTKVGQMVKNAGQTWGGSWIALTSPIDFSSSLTFTMKVYSPRIGAKVLLKVENISDGGKFFEKEVETTVANEWEELSFDYSAINTSDTYQKIVLIFDNGTMGDGTSNYTFLVDDIMLKENATSVNRLEESNISVFSYNQQLFVACDDELINGSIQVYDITGREISKRKISSNTSILNLKHSGIHIVRISDRANQPVYSTKILIK